MNKLFMRLLFAAMAAVICVGCAHDSDELLATVPADASGVAVINVRDFASKSGVEVKDGQLTLPEGVSARGFAPEVMERLAKVAQGVNLDHVVIFEASSDSPILTFAVTDKDALIEAIADDYTHSDNNGYDVYTSGREAILLKDGQGWMLKSTRPVEIVTGVLAEAKTASMLKHTGVVDFLNTSGTARAAVDASQFSKDLKDQWGCFNLKVSNESISADMQIMSSDGKVRDIASLQTLSTDFLRYVSSEANVVAAVGATKGMDWDGIAMSAAMLPGMRIGGMIDTLLPYLKKADGTVAIASEVNPAALDKAGQHFMVMIHMPQPDVEAAVAEVRSRFTSMGAEAHAAENGVTVLSAGPSRFYLGNVDGYLALSSWPLTPTYSNSLNPYFLSRKGAVAVLLPTLAPLMDSANFGVNFDVEVQTSMVTATLKLTGTDTPIIPAIMSLIP
ncbi:MAG: hypothetical protein NC043_09110 [Muribaculaceae bacterium]|nr:hypothetical protein [Muribaculaceae bacterium]